MAYSPFTNSEYNFPSGNNVYSNAQGDFTATANAGAKTVTITGLPFTLNSLHVISGMSKVIDSNGNVTVIPLTNVTVSTGVITYGNKGSNFAAGDTVLIILTGPDKSYDLSLDGLQVVEQVPVWTRYSSKETLIGAAQDLTNAFADVGTEIDVRGYTKLVIFATLDINNSSDVRMRALAKHTSAGAEEYVYPLKISGLTETKVIAHYYEFDTDADQLMILDWDVTAIDYIQLQVMAATVGGTAGQIDALYAVKQY